MAPVPAHLREYELVWDNLHTFCFGKPYDAHTALSWCPFIDNRYKDGATYTAIVRHLTRIASEYSSEKLLALDPRGNRRTIFNEGQLLLGRELKEICGEPLEVPVHMFSKGEGLFVPPGSAVFSFASDCGTVLLYDPAARRLVLCHAGRNSLLPTRDEWSTYSSDTFRSVIDNSVRCLTRMGSRPQDLQAKILLAIRGEEYPHPEMGPHKEHNAKLLHTLSQGIYNKFNCVKEVETSEKCGIDLTNVITAQLVKQGVPKEKILRDGIDTYTDPRYYSWKRLSTNGYQRNMSNGILVIHGA